ncbi:hypothetical protein [Maribellus luteus]|nr:hypothetical protein [Maribellus luteus]
MKSCIKHIMTVFVALGFAVAAQAQWNSGNINVRFSVPEIAIVDIEPELGYIEFSVNAPDIAGGEPVVEHVSNESVWINYTSAIRRNGNRRSINAQISEGTIPDGISFYVEASFASAFGSINQGNPVGRVQITNQPHPIITGIGSCFTGDGVGKGHELKYFLEISDFSQMKSIEDQVFTVLYTITDN